MKPSRIVVPRGPAAAKARQEARAAKTASDERRNVVIEIDCSAGVPRPREDSDVREIEVPQGLKRLFCQRFAARLKAVPLQVLITLCGTAEAGNRFFSLSPPADRW